MTFNTADLDRFPLQPGVYLMKDIQGKILYIGKANQLRVRVKQYFSPGRDLRAMIPILIKQIAEIDFIVVPSGKEALLLENTLIKKHQPKFNALLKDDKTYISLMINTPHSWPMIRLVRYKTSPTEKGRYFGPYPSAYAARHTYELLTRLFPLRQCSDEELKRRTRPCILYGMKRCIAPCVNKCTKEEYTTYVNGAISFLQGRNQEILNTLRTAMQEASDSLEFERAGHLLKTIHQIEQVVSTQQVVAQAQGKNTDAIATYIHGSDVILVQVLFREGKLLGVESHFFSNVAEEEEGLLTSFILQHYQNIESLPEEILVPCALKDADVLSEIFWEAHKKKVAILFPQKGEKRTLVSIAETNAKSLFEKQQDHKVRMEKMLLDLQEALKLNRYPRRIACFDNSHLQGSNPVASLVTFFEGEKERKNTRLFKIKTAPTGDDLAAMREALMRHLTRAKATEELPDLIIVDGGKTQLGAAREVLRELDIASVDLIALAKQEGRHDKGMTQEQIFLCDHHDPILLNPRSTLLLLLQKIRDETHRTALAFHRKRRQKQTISSSLSDVEGIGPVKRKKLLRHFGSVHQIKQATREDFEKLTGLTKRDIETLLNWQSS